MNIGIDLDGVIFNSEMFFMSMGEIYDCSVLHKNSIIKLDEPRVQNKYNWSKEELDGYIERYSYSSDFDVMPGATIVINALKKAGVKITIVSARGQFNTKEIQIADDKLKSSGITGDKYFWGHLNKTEICLKEGIDVMIDDRYDVCLDLAARNIRCLYFRMAGRKKICDNDKILEVVNWGEVYRYFYNIGILR